jgi:hypothetical protein
MITDGRTALTPLCCVPRLEPALRRLEKRGELQVELFELAAKLEEREVEAPFSVANMKLRLISSDRRSTFGAGHEFGLRKAEHCVSDVSEDAIGSSEETQYAPSAAGRRAADAALRQPNDYA